MWKIDLHNQKFSDDLFIRFKNTSSEFIFLDYESTDFEFPYLSKMSRLFEKMYDVSYDRKDAIIHMSTKEGKVYSVDEINEMNLMSKMNKI